MLPTASYTRSLAEYLHGMRFENFSQHVVDMAKMCVEDFIGVAIAGSVKKESGIWQKYYADKPSAPQASLFKPGFSMTSVEHAAALNAVFGHVMDMDDVHNTSITHLAVITIPTAFALGQNLRSSGQDVIEAIVAGYEAGARIGEAINPSSYYYWHTTAVVGSFSAGVAAAKLLKLSEDEFVNCLASAGTQAAGLWEFIVTGAMSKVLHTAHANLAGIRSAELAKLGFTGAPAILEGDRGFVKAVAPEYHLDYLTRDFGEGYAIEKNSFKPYACCRHIHSAAYGVERILAEHSINPKDIESIVDETYEAAYQTACDPQPESSYAAKFSIQFCIAAKLLLGSLNDEVFTEENIRDSDIQSLIRKIDVRVNPDFNEEFKADPTKWIHCLTLRLRSGEIIIKRIEYPIGDFKNPFDSAAADRKFRSLTDAMLDNATSDKLLEKIHLLEKVSDMGEIFL